tara:strand:+ start:429 stop:1310 length:882 start_codon:yes stop_codon:yes gene_type:complete
MKNLNNSKKKIYSQNGEDGVIEEILNRLVDNLDKTCCEFGAWDGMYLSNVYNLIKNKDYKALFIEADKNKFKKLNNNFDGKKIITLNKYVSFEGKNKLDQILLENNFNTNFDLLSIDIDGNDYHIFDSLQNFKPKIIVIEFNPLIPNEVEFIQKKDIKINQGSSALSFYNLAKRKNYTLVAATEINLFFVHNNYISKVTDNIDPKLDEIVDDKPYRNFIFTGFDGKIFTSKKFNMPWHKIDVDEIKILPNFLQKFPDNYNFLEKTIFKLYKNYINPKRLVKKFTSIFSKKSDH